MNVADPEWGHLGQVSEAHRQEESENTMVLVLPGTLTFGKSKPVFSEAFPFLCEENVVLPQFHNN